MGACVGGWVGRGGPLIGCSKACHPSMLGPRERKKQRKRERETGGFQNDAGGMSVEDVKKKLMAAKERPPREHTTIHKTP